MPQDLLQQKPDRSIDRSEGAEEAMVTDGQSKELQTAWGSVLHSSVLEGGSRAPGTAHAAGHTSALWVW